MHTNPEVLTLLALGDRPVDASEIEHVAACERCRAELESLTSLIEHGRTAPDRESLDEPSEAVWAAIQSELGFIPMTRSWPSVPDPATPAAVGPASASPDPAAPAASSTVPAANGAPTRRDSPPAGSAADPVNRRRDRRPRVVALVLAATLALIAGIGIGLGVDRLRQPSETVIGRATLEALPAWRGANGTATVELDRAGNRTLTVDVRTPQPTPGSQQVWLVDQASTAMQPMGFLSAGGHGSLPIPPTMDLSRFSVVDVSNEPAGDTTAAPSGDTIVRGELQR